MPGNLVEDRGQTERQVLAEPPGVAVGDRHPPQVRGGTHDNLTVGTNEVDRVGHCSPEVRSIDRDAPGQADPLKMTTGAGPLPTRGTVEPSHGPSARDEHDHADAGRHRRRQAMRTSLGHQGVPGARPAAGGCAQSAAGQRTVMCLPCDGGSNPKPPGRRPPALPPGSPLAADPSPTRLPTGPGWVNEPKLDRIH